MDLLIATSPAWTETVLADFDAFLADHAACERNYPDKPSLVLAMSELAVEELVHYREVLKWMAQRGVQQRPDQKDRYIMALHKCMRRGTHTFMRDRLLLAGIIECRGHERFGLVAAALPAGPLKQFYRSLTQSEDRHHELFLALAQKLCPRDRATYEDQTGVSQRLSELLSAEANIIETLPLRSALH
ncbi:MAG: tRNA-(ms[2]io[6]A)-hydroxylase [Gammaproteobacteria bacterium]